MRYAEVILPLPLPGVFTYSIPTLYKQQSLIGCRVIVPFGKRKYYTGVVYNVVEKTNTQYAVKDVLDILDNEPILNSLQLIFQTWISEYYMCVLGDAYNAALPSGLKLTSESYIGLLPDREVNYFTLSEKESLVIQFLENQELSTDEVKKITGLKHPFRVIKELVDKDLVYLYEKVKDKYAPKRETRLRLNERILDNDELDEIANNLEKKPKQLNALLAYLKLVPILESPTDNKKGIAKKDLIKRGISPSSVSTLAKNGVFQIWEQVVNRFSFEDEHVLPIPQLSDHQKIAKQQIQESFEKNDTTLLKGITGSGKTEIYIQLIDEIIETGGKALYLLPEIALTTQIIQRFRKYFGNRFGVYHSRFSDNERVEIYNNCLNNKYDFIIGVRSSVFLPFDNLQLIIVDEEHEYSYKQHAPAPRYHARDSAIYLGHLHSAKVLLGSATPSLESYHNAQEKKYGYVQLDHRYDSQPLPEIRFADMAKAKKQRKIKGNFTYDLLEEIERSLAKDKQIILFQNRRGYAPFIECESCHHIPNCPNCAVSLTYHIYQNQLICHYCGYKLFNEPTCEACKSTEVKTVGSGTEQIEEELSLLLPEVRVKRMDLDTTRNKYSYQNIIDDFESGEIQVLIGTQMISKGLDFEHVNLVGVFDADSIIHFPDFRSHERAFQLITQVSGRAGRKHEKGIVIVQTKRPDQPILHHIKEGHLDLFYKEELNERQRFKYPPYYRLIKTIIRHKDKNVLAQAAGQLSVLLKKDLTENRVLGPIEPIIGKIRNYYILEILIKVEKQAINLKAVKHFIAASRDTLLALPSFKSVMIHFDVDPI